MKNIELSLNQKNKLLEMCKVLFPEWTFITFQESAIMGAGWDYDFNNICFSKKSETLFDIEINIHWFEYCWKILNKILSNNEIISPIYKQEIILNFGIICFNNSYFQHPIDYLYEKFKEYEEN